MNEQELEKTLLEIVHGLQDLQQSKRTLVDKWIRPLLIALFIALFGAVGNTVKNAIKLERQIHDQTTQIEQIKHNLDYNFSVIEKHIDKQVQLIRFSDN